MPFVIALLVLYIARFVGHVSRATNKDAVVARQRIRKK